MRLNRLRTLAVIAGCIIVAGSVAAQAPTSPAAAQAPTPPAAAFPSGAKFAYVDIQRVGR